MYIRKPHNIRELFLNKVLSYQPGFLVSVIWRQFCIEKSRLERESCPLSGIEKRPPLGGYLSIKVMLDTIRNTTVVRCREAVLFSEGPLSEARLY